MSPAVQEDTPSNEITILKTKLNLIFSCGVFFWAVTSGFIYRKLDKIDSTIDKVYGLETEVKILSYQNGIQSQVDTQLVQQMDRIKEQYAEISSRISKLESNSLISR